MCCIQQVGCAGKMIGFACCVRHTAVLRPPGAATATVPGPGGKLPHGASSPHPPTAAGLQPLVHIRQDHSATLVAYGWCMLAPQATSTAALHAAATLILMPQAALCLAAPMRQQHFCGATGAPPASKWHCCVWHSKLSTDVRRGGLPCLTNG